MDRNDIRYQTYVQILHEELVPAMGCTEPIALAYAAARARDVLKHQPEKVTAQVSNNIIKNVKSVVVPNTNGLKGIEAALAAGIVGGKAEKVLEVIADVTDKQKDEMKQYLCETPIEVIPLDNENTFDMIITVYYQEETAKVRITQYHTNIIYIERNGKVLYSIENQDKLSEKEKFDDSKELGLADKSLLNIKDILEFAKSADMQDVKEVLDRQITYNMAIAEEGLTNNYGANIGKTRIKVYGDGVQNRAVAKAAAASDARMCGCEMPVIINSGSGNQGITVSVPVIEYARELGVSDRMLYEALIVTNLVAIHQKAGIGRLSAYCGAVSAGCAAGCGIAYLHGGGYKELAHTLVNSLAIVSGIICDGAKPSCAAKIASSIEAGIFGYQMYENGQEFMRGDGIVTCGVEETIKNVGQLGKEGMKETDKEIVKIMLQYKEDTKLNA